ncbi:hypothetical protein [Bradyrhizobium prioriisuperbiae]|uniref:hypothetical protein n=1 Tax=Bradyrhizobium prioriisuperbiae TaxID=2854389 RepID=UPI0028E864FD|nr:hypothetical protein [Bradyrhizobium prioritasuperba]
MPLADSALAAIAPRSLAEAFACIHPVCEPPYATVRLEVRALWHERRRGDASQDWLRGILQRATDHLRETATG